MGKLENFINDNRGEFDADEMKINWENIRSGIIQKKSRIPGRRLWRAAAAAVIICVSGLLFFNRDQTPPTAMEPPLELPSKDVTDLVDPDYTHQMDQFAILIEHKQNELKQTQATQPELYRQFLQDNNRLDSSYNYLKSELSENPNKEILLDALIQNLQLRLDLLNQQLQIIKQSKNKKTDNESKSI